jgi:hypothetical protein
VTTPQRAQDSRWLVVLLAALTAVLALLLPATPASATPSPAAETRVGAKAGRAAAEGVGGFGNPLAMVPTGASRRGLTPSGGVTDGVEFKWLHPNGHTVRLRAHGPDTLAPPGSNAATGPIYRVQIGKRYADADGNLYPQGVSNPKSPYYDPAAANATHIPWPHGIPLPW